MKLGLAAIMRDEAPYVLEWVAFHKAMGIDRIVVADNGSTDGTTEILAALHRAGEITHIPFPDPPEGNPQMHAYDLMLREHAAGLDWIGFLDADEFLVPTDSAGSVRPAFESLPAEAGGLALSWAVFGSSGIERPLPSSDPGPVTERFVWRSAKAFAANRHTKVFVRPDAACVDVSLANPHALTLTRGLRYVGAASQPVSLPPEGNYGVMDVTWERLRVNHYAIKSHQEYVARKRTSRNATGGPARDKAYFGFHDRNDVRDELAPHVLAASAAERTRLRLVVTKHGLGDLRLATALRTDEATDMALRFESVLFSRTTGHRLIAGWAADALGTPALMDFDLVFAVEGATCRAAAMVSVPRRDLARRGHLPPMTGFRVLLPPLPWSSASASIRILQPNVPVCEIPGSLVVPVLTLPSLHADAATFELSRRHGDQRARLASLTVLPPDTHLPEQPVSPVRQFLARTAADTPAERLRHVARRLGHRLRG